MHYWITGASSFTAFHLIHHLYQRGHRVTVSLSSPLDEYQGVRLCRVQRLPSEVLVLDACPFGSDTMLEHLSLSTVDVFCHHGSWTRRLHQTDFDLQSAMKWNTHQIHQVLRTLVASGCRQLVYTDSYFAQHASHISPYALSKRLTREALQFYSESLGISFRRIVLPNPIGPWDNVRLLETFYRLWADGEVPTLFVAKWIRDQLPISALLPAWVSWLEVDDGSHHFEPSGTVLDMHTWLLQFQAQVQHHTGWSCEWQAVHQPTGLSKSYPRVLHNRDRILVVDTEQTEFWDGYLAHLDWRLQHQIW